MNNDQILKLRKEFSEIAMQWKADAPATSLKDIFYPSTHLRALQLDRLIVIGMRGAGKSFWSSVLANSDLRQATAKKYPHLRYETIEAVRTLRWDDQRENDDLPEPETISNALNEGISPRLMWLALVLNVLRPDFAQNSISMDMPSGNWKSRFQWCTQDPERAFASLRLLNQLLEGKNKRVLVLTDGLDRMAPELRQSNDCLRGLFQFLLDQRKAKGLSFKAFVREDMTMREVANFPDASKLINEAIKLDWTREDLYALIWKKLGQHSLEFRKLVKTITNQSWEGGNQSAWMHKELEDPKETGMQAILRMLTTMYLGSNKKRGITYSWWFKHLADSKNRVSPRTFQHSFTTAICNKPEVGFFEQRTHVLMPADIQRGVQSASQDRVAELREGYHWIETALDAFRAQVVPVEWKKIEEIWSANQVQNKIADACKKFEVFIPWEDSQTGVNVSQRLRRVLEEIGVIEVRSDGTKIDIPDIYRVGYGIGKKGGVPPNA